MTPVSWLLILQNVTSFMLENYLPTGIISSNLSLEAGFPWKASIIFSFGDRLEQWIFTSMHRDKNRAGHLSFSPVLLPEFHDSHKFWFLLARKIHLLSLGKKCMLSKQKTTTNLLSSSSFSKFVLIVELIFPISTTASSSWPWRNKTQV